jgi:hypothetical protein
MHKGTKIFWTLKKVARHQKQFLAIGNSESMSSGQFPRNVLQVIDFGAIWM